MAHKSDFSCNLSDFHDLQYGRGRGVSYDRTKLTSGYRSQSVGASPSFSASVRSAGVEQNPVSSPLGRYVQGETHTSTPSVNSDTLQQLSDMIGQIGFQIGDSIASRILANRAIGIGSGDVDGTSSDDRTSQLHEHSFPQVNVQVKSDREPPIFRGDDTDKYNVQEWVELMRAYIKKQKCCASEQTEEVMSRLMGKARDVVKIGLRSDPSLSSTQTPEVVYNMLLQYFSDTSSCLPLADFYSTLPKHKENPVDYWIRINKAADLADEGLRRQGRKMDNIGEEVARMFVRYCPDSDLAFAFKSKPIYEWTTKEIQGRIDEYQREQRSSKKVVTPQQHKSHNAVLLNNETHPDLNCHPDPEVCNNKQPFPTEPFLVHAPQLSDERILNRMMGMLEQVLDKVQKKTDFTPAPYGGRSRRGPLAEQACKVCRDKGHTTKSHCMSEKLCFGCFTPGHVKRNCSNGLTLPSNPNQGN